MNSCISDQSESSRGGDHDQQQKMIKYKGVRCRKWGKWVSEIRVPGTQDRLWLGSYTTPRAAAVAHDIASYCLRGPSSLDNLNFPLTTLPASVRTNMSPRSIQKAASDAGMAVDAQFAINQQSPTPNYENNTLHGVGHIWETSGHDPQMIRQGEDLNISVEDYL
ncbi:integrase-type DNA-binding superfamily protein [Actinidia rufa]|uniref:Integrase-type DNA-binding superfamily protein n=1 Tax=Actinidia rufa TaxID=165716 RepID=A0A7J0GFZ5_9ERIC|nr:integrase-type DNA-binding superfamily protein [Actinidia rufa]